MQHLSSRKDEAQAKTDEKKDARGAHFKVVTQPGSELMPEHGHPAGWVGKTAERAELARQGDGWKSDA